MNGEIWTRKENYIVETKRNFEIRWEEHSDINKISEPPMHLKSIYMESFNGCIY